MIFDDSYAVSWGAAQ